MSNSPTVDEALEAVYVSLANDNQDIDLHIKNLKNALKNAEEKQAVLDPQRLFQNNREGRKMLQGYFKRRGVSVVFKK